MKISNAGGAILVAGATGQQGGAVVRHLLARGFVVHALVRDAAKPKAAALADLGVTPVIGDLNDADSLVAAMAGADGVFSVQNPRDSGPEVEVAQGKALAEAAKRCGIGHFVYSSVASADQETGVPIMESKFEIENFIRSLGLPFTIVRPVSFMENWTYMEAAFASGIMPQPLSPQTHLQQIAVDDIGAFVAAAFADRNTWIGRTVELAGDDATIEEIASTISAVKGKPIRHVQTPWPEYEKTMGRSLALLMKWIEAHGYRADPAVLRSMVPGAHTLRDFLKA